MRIYKNENAYRDFFVCRQYRIARLSKPKTPTHDFAQTIRKKILKQKTSYPNSWCVVSAVGTFCLTSLLSESQLDSCGLIGIETFESTVGRNNFQI